VSWAGSTTTRFTEALEELGAYLATVMDQTAVIRLLGISWAAVGAIVERVVARQLDPGRLDGIRRIGVDEFSYRKRHRYLTLVVDHDRERVVWPRSGEATRRSRASSRPWGRSASRSSSSRRLSTVQRRNAPLCRAYLLKETLAQALDYLQPKVSFLTIMIHPRSGFLRNMIQGG
jgi:transposase